MKIRYLTVQEIVGLNVVMIQKYAPDEQIGLLSQSLLESAVFRPQQSAFGEDAYPTIIEKSVALFESLGQNHAFQNANKRTAFIAMLMFLEFNGYIFSMETKMAEDFTVDMVNHEYTFEKLVEIVRNNSKMKGRSD